MITIEGGCHRCGMFTYNSKHHYDANKGQLTCQSCWEKYYSIKAIRDAKLNKLLKKSIWSKITNFFRV